MWKLRAAIRVGKRRMLAEQFYILSMMVITAKKRYGSIKTSGIVRVLKATRKVKQ